MSKQNIFSKPKIIVGSGRNDFDRSYIENYASHLGTLDICCCLPCVAGTKGKINRSTFTRTASVVSPAFPHVTEHFDFFKVPLKSLWSAWEDYKLNVNDLKSSFFSGYDYTESNPLPSKVPLFSYSDLKNVLISNFGNSSATTAQKTTAAAVANQCLSLLEEMHQAYPRSETIATKFNLLPFAAYHKIYYEHYRNFSYETNQPALYNLDSLFDLVLGDSSFSLTSLNANTKLFMFRKHMVNYRMDYFHNIYPSLNYTTSVPNGIFKVPASVAGIPADANYGSPLDNRPFVLTSQGGSTMVSNFEETSMEHYASLPVSVQSIRAAFALDKLQRASAYAPKHIREQYMAQFGVDVPEDKSETSQRLGSFQSDVLFQEVTNMAASETNALGELGAKGIGSGSQERDIDFYCEHDSLIIGLHYFMVRSMYDAFDVSPWNVASVREEFYQRAFENLGLRPMYAYELNGYHDTYLNNILGFKVPNAHYKASIDRNLGPFKDTFPEFGFNSQGYTYNGSVSSVLRSFTNHTLYTVGSTPGVNMWYFKISPYDLNHIFETQFDGTYKPSQPQFFGQYRIKFATIAPMSVHGQPV